MPNRNNAVGKRNKHESELLLSNQLPSESYHGTTSFMRLKNVFTSFKSFTSCRYSIKASKSHQGPLNVSMKFFLKVTTSQ